MESAPEKTNTTTAVLIATALLPAQCAQLKTLLEAEGWTPVFAKSCHQALQAATLQPPVLALVDTDLPGIGGGMEVCRQLSLHSTTAVPVILRTKSSSLHNRTKGLQAGALCSIPIAADTSEIHLHMRNQLRHWQQPHPIESTVAHADGLAAAHLSFDHLPYAVIITDARHKVVQANAAATRLVKTDAAAWWGRSLSEVFSALRLNVPTAWVLQKVDANGVWQGEVHVRPGDGMTQAFWLHALAIKNDAPYRLQYHAFFLSDITHLILREHRLRWLAETDALTGLANRNLFVARLNEAIALSALDSSNAPSILFIDLDGFKQVNDQLGHGKGDRVLCSAAKLLESSVRANDMAARLGGDEFVVLLIGATHSTLAETARRINERLRIDLAGDDGQPLCVTCSIGAAVYPHDGHDANSLLKVADRSMYASKRGGKNRSCFSSTDLVPL